MLDLPRRAGLTLCAGTLIVTPAADAQSIRMNFEEMVATAATIVVAEAIDARSEWVTTGSSRVIITRRVFRVTETLKGNERVLLPLEFLGGTVGTTRQSVSGVPEFETGDRAVLFVLGTRAVSPIVGHDQGRFHITLGPDGTEYVTLPDRRAFSAVSQIGNPVTVSPVPVPTMPLTAFRSEVNRVLGQ